MSEGNIPDNVLEHFKNVRDDSGVPISTQIKMRESGYKIVKGNEGGSDIHLKCEPHELLEYTGEDEFLSVGNIITKDGVFISAEILDDIIINIDDINRVRAFLDEAEMMINND